MWELDKKKDWVLKDWWLQTVLLEKTLESPFYCKEIKPVNHKGNKSWIFIGRIDAETEAPVIWPPDAKSWLTGKTLRLGKIEGRRRREWQRMRRLDGITKEIWIRGNSGRWWRTVKPGILSPWGCSVRYNWVTEEQQQAMVNQSMTKATGIYNCNVTVSSISDSGKTGQEHVKGWN